MRALSSHQLCEDWLDAWGGSTAIATFTLDFGAALCARVGTCLCGSKMLVTGSEGCPPTGETGHVPGLLQPLPVLPRLLATVRGGAFTTRISQMSKQRGEAK